MQRLGAAGAALLRRSQVWRGGFVPRGGTQAGWGPAPRAGRPGTEGLTYRRPQGDAAALSTVSQQLRYATTQVRVGLRGRRCL